MEILCIALLICTFEFRAKIELFIYLQLENAAFRLKEYLESIKYYTTMPPRIKNDRQIEISVYPMLHQIVKVVCLNVELLNYPIEIKICH